ncbi:MAG: glycine betaine ABC transporter substrate-binding protein [Desulfohalobiaceae bacterium]
MFKHCIALLAILAAILACSPLQAQKQQEPLKLAYVAWSSEIASTHLVQAVLQERMHIPCEIIEMQADQMWEAVAAGEVDAMVSAWLPETHKHYYEQYENQVQNLGPNLEGARIGLVVPNTTLGRQTAGTGLRNQPYITIDSISEIKEHADKFRHRIIGIDPESGVMHRTKEAMQAYDLDNFRLTKGSEVSMTAELKNAILKKEWIVVTGWVPHWMFARWDLKFLEDPEGVYGGEEHIATIARQGLEEDRPEAYAFLQRFHWKPEQMGQLMLWNQEDDGLYPYENALRWIRNNKKQVDSWLQE